MQQNSSDNKQQTAIANHQTPIIKHQSTNVHRPSPITHHFVFAGTGLASLLTVYEMIQSGKFADKSILLLDVDAKKTNDRTWCFWEKDQSEFEELINKTWETAIFANENFNLNLDFEGYKYKMIRGEDFYNFVFKLISEQKNITFSQEKILFHEEINEKVIITTKNNTYTADKLFNSILDRNLIANSKKYPLLNQHFLGWFIKSGQAVFNAEIATFMDFSVPQENNTQFMYVLPTSSTEALLEPTYFSSNLQEKAVYENKIKAYAEKLGIKNFEITEKERGNIPMTCYPFWKHNTKNVVNIGSAGGWTKASTGFTFKHSTKKARSLVKFLETESDFTKFHKKTKFWYYDLLFIDVLFKNNAIGSSVFSGMFKKEKAALVFKFLDEETTFSEDLKIILSCPKLPFIKAVFGRLF